MKLLKNFVVMNVADAEMLEDREYSRYDITIQSGCANTKKRIALLCDNEGDNISELNPYYSELTAMYWIWKHEKADYIGWSHYRRRLDISDEEIDEYMKQGIDLILPKPYSLKMSIKEQFLTMVSIDCWEGMVEVVREMHPEMYDKIIVLCEQHELFPACMGIFKYEYFSRYCEWLFPMLERIYERVGERWDPYQKRYIAFLAERLQSAYHIIHANDIKSVIVPLKIFGSKESQIITDGVSEEDIFVIVDEYLKEKEATRAYMYVDQLYNRSTQFGSQNLNNLYLALFVNRYEAMRSQESLCKYHTDSFQLSLYMGQLTNWLNLLSEGKMINYEELISAVQKLKISKLGLEYLVRNVCNNAENVLLHLDKFWSSADLA